MFATTNAEQLSLFEEASLSAPGRSDEEVVRDLASWLLEDAEARPPVDLHILASMRGIARIMPADQPWAGQLSLEGPRLVVRVRETDGSPRQRFTIGHEVIHTFLPGFADAPRRRCDPGAPRDRVEHLCDVGASELLFPRRWFIDDLGRVRAGMDGVETLAEAYEASVEATARRWVDLAPEPSLMLVFKTMTKPSEPAAEPRLRLAYGHGTPDAWPFPRPWKSVGDDSPFLAAAQGDPVEVRTRLGDLVSGDVGVVHVSARVYGAGRVIALVRRAA